MIDGNLSKDARVFLDAYAREANPQRAEALATKVNAIFNGEAVCDVIAAMSMTLAVHLTVSVGKGEYQRAVLEAFTVLVEATMDGAEIHATVAALTRRQEGNHRRRW